MWGVGGMEGIKSVLFVLKKVERECDCECSPRTGIGRPKHLPHIQRTAWMCCCATLGNESPGNGSGLDGAT